jgi:hypothetical protein
MKLGINTRSNTYTSIFTSNPALSFRLALSSVRLISQHLPRRTLHPQLRIPPMRQLERPRLRRPILALGRRIHKHALEMERRHLLFIIRANLHGEQSIRRPLLRDQRRVAAPHDDLLWQLAPIVHLQELGIEDWKRGITHLILLMFHHLKMIRNLRPHLISALL